MALGSAQTFVMCLWFKEREKDKATLAGEVMFEYEQKVSRFRHSTFVHGPSLITFCSLIHRSSQLFAGAVRHSKSFTSCARCIDDE